MDSPREPRTLADLLERAARSFGDRRALSFAAEQLPASDLTFSQLNEQVRAASCALTSLGLRSGDRLGLLLHNGPELIVLWLAAARLGVTTVPLNTRYRPPELRYVIVQARLRVLITASSTGGIPNLAQRVNEAVLDASSAPSLKRVVVLNANGVTLATLHEKSEPTPDRPEVAGSGIALIMYTSGTTAEPKGCLLTHATLLETGRALAQDFYHLGASDCMWNPLPMFHLSALHPFTACLWSGCTFLSMTHFDPDIGARQVTGEPISILYPAFPMIVNDLLQVRGFSGPALRYLRRVNCVAPPDALRRLQQNFPQAAVTSAYGLTEAGGVVSYGSAQDSLDVRATTCGKPFKGIEMRIATNEGDLPGVGELQIRGWCLFVGYFDQPQATSAVMTDDGWLRTGDLGSFDSEGRIQYRGRLKDMIRVGGENVAALEIESVLVRESAVKIAQVVALADERYGEVPVAFVELHPGARATAEELIESCRARLASFKVPRRILFVTQWPMSATKIQKHRLREQLDSAQPKS